MDSQNGKEPTEGSIKPRQLEDWITSSVEYTDGISSPELFRLWAAISSVAGAAERRVWIESRKRIVFPNLYTLLVSTPGVGKSEALSFVNTIWRGVKKIKVSPDNMTKAALIDALASADRKLILPDNRLIDFHALAVASSEFGVLVPGHDLDFLSVLNHIFDNPPYYRELRRGRKEEDDIPKPTLNIVAGTQPAYLSNLLPEVAWGQGFTSRLIMVYSSSPVNTPLFDQPPFDKSLYTKLEADMTQMLGLYGRMILTPEAKLMAEDWSKGNLEPIPTHPKLEHYRPRRILYFLKLSMISSLSRGNSLEINAFDVSRAKGWLLFAETFMPDIFKEMTLKSDSQVIQDLHYFAWQTYQRENQRPLHISRLIYYLQAKVPSEKVKKVIEIAEAAHVIERAGGTTDQYIPRPKDSFGLEDVA